MKKALFYIHKRAEKNAYYVYYVNPDSNNIEVKKSIRKLYVDLYGIDKTKFFKSEAYSIAYEALSKNLITFKTVVNASKEEEQERVYFNSYCLDFWDYERSDYVRRKNKEKPNSINVTHVRESLGRFKKYVVPCIPDSLELKDFKPFYAERIKDKLLDDNVSSSTINKVLSSIRSPLSEAYRLGYIEEDVADRIKDVESVSRSYGVIEKGEVIRLLKYMDANYPKGTYERAYYLMVQVALNTGARVGEVRALKKEDLMLVNENLAMLNISKSFNQDVGVKTTKNTKGHLNPIPLWLYEELKEYAEFYDQEFIFFSPYAEEQKPIGNKAILKAYKRSLENIGISESEQEERNIAFHSLRVCYASFLNGNIDDSDRMKLMNHSSMAMTDHYTHDTLDSLEELSKKINEVIPTINDKPKLRAVNA